MKKSGVRTGFIACLFVCSSAFAVMDVDGWKASEIIVAGRITGTSPRPDVKPFWTNYMNSPHLRSWQADFVVAACNSIHLVYDEVSRNIPIPWVSIMDVTAERIKEDRMTHVGLLGTLFTMGKGFYQAALARHGIEVITPCAETQEKLNDIIFGELVRNEVRPESKKFVLECIEALGQRGAEGVILGCTELPFLIRQEDTRIPVFDSAAIHAQRALELATAPSR